MMDQHIWTIIQFIVVFGIFALLVYAAGFIVNKIKSSDTFKNSKFLNPTEYFPEEQISTLKQLFYLGMILLFIVIDLYLIFDWFDALNIVYSLDIIISAYLFINMRKETLKDRIILFLLIPFSSMSIILFGQTWLELFDLLHIFVYVYFIRVYYHKFVEYTENNGLGITIILLYAIILVSFIFTILVENVSPLDSIVMVSNAFTSNSFDAAGNSVIGKIDSLVLAWGGFILSGVGTATLSVSMIRRYTNTQFDNLENKIKNKKEK